MPDSQTGLDAHLRTTGRNFVLFTIIIFSFDLRPKSYVVLLETLVVSLISEDAIFPLVGVNVLF